MRLTTRARYGLRALCHMAHRGDASARVIAERQGIPRRYLEEIIAELRRAGLVVGKRGPGGGYRLARPPQQIAVSEVLRALRTVGSVGLRASSADEISVLVESSVDQRIEALFDDLQLDKLLVEAHGRRCRAPGGARVYPAH